MLGIFCLFILIDLQFKFLKSDHYYKSSPISKI